MDTRIAELKNDFNNIITIRTSVKSVFESLEQRIGKLKNLYADFIKHNENALFVFGLDSFRFQSRLIDLEYEDMKRLFLAINNRMYCEYFKLYKIVCAYITNIITDKKVLEIIKINNFPAYKDLEPFKEYNIETIQELHENILLLVNSMLNNIEVKENELFNYQGKRKIGLSIDNFVASFNFDIIMIREKVSLFLTYVEFFHKLHTKYLKRFSHKIQLMYTHVNTDIRFDDYIEINRKGGASLENLSHIGDSSDVESTRMNTPCNSICSDSVGDVDTRRNSFLGFCSKNNIDFDSDCIQHNEPNEIFDVIETTCENILNPDLSRVIQQSIAETKRVEDAKRLEEEDKRIEHKQRLEAQRIEDETRLEEEKRLVTQRIENETRLEEEKRLEAQRIENETRLEEEKRLEVQRIEDETRLEEEKRLEVQRIENETRLEVQRIEDETRLEEEKRLEAQRIEDETRLEAQRIEDETRLEEEKREMLNLHD
jgi:hypothetical protein